MRQKQKEGFVCRQCGRCCVATDHVCIYPEDITRWKSEGRTKLITPEMLEEWDYFGSSGLFDNRKTFRCPFLSQDAKDKYSCKLNQTKPSFCRLFPAGKTHAKQFCDCQGYR